MKKLVVLVSALALAAAAQAATVVLKGGKRLEVQRYVKQGNYVVVEYGPGRLESYPLAAVDLAATAAANAKAVTATPVPTPAGPHSPFLDARSTEGAAAFTVTDADVSHVEEEQPGADDAGKKPATAGGVVLLSYDKSEVEPGLWDITATVLNRADVPVRNIQANVTLADAQGASVGAGSASYADELGPGMQGALRTQVHTSGAPAVVSFDLSWQELREAKPLQRSGEAEPMEPPVAVPMPTPAPPSYGMPPGSSPTTVPSNPMSRPDLTRPPADTAPQTEPPPQATPAR